MLGTALWCLLRQKHPFAYDVEYEAFHEDSFMVCMLLQFIEFLSIFTTF